MREDRRVKRTPEQYEAEIAEEMRKGHAGKVEWLTTRFDRDYPPAEETA